MCAHVCVCWGINAGTDVIKYFNVFLTDIKGNKLNPPPPQNWKPMRSEVEKRGMDGGGRDERGRDERGWEG